MLTNIQRPLQPTHHVVHWKRRKALWMKSTATTKFGFGPAMGVCLHTGKLSESNIMQLGTDGWMDRFLMSCIISMMFASLGSDFDIARVIREVGDETSEIFACWSRIIDASESNYCAQLR